MLETTGKVISAKKQYWFKVKTKAVNLNPMDAQFPSIIKVSYNVDGVEYTKRKWLGHSLRCPNAGESVKVLYDSSNPKKAEIVYISGPSI